MKERLFWSNLGDVILAFFYFVTLFFYLKAKEKVNRQNGDSNNEKSKKIITR